MNRRGFLKTAGAGAVVALAGSRSEGAAGRPPNFVIIFTDDQGYNDVGCYGAPLIKTPRLDRMAAEGMKFTDFYSAAPVCTPSRAALMTGCYAQRVSMARFPKKLRTKKFGSVLGADAVSGLHSDEITIAEILKNRGYATACVGKWHLGHLQPFLPTNNGFDSYYGVPYSNDMKPGALMRNEKVIETSEDVLAPDTQAALTERYTDESVRFITENWERPFFLYLAHTMPHTPLHVSERFKDKSAGGLYGDVIECIDWSVGRILDTLSYHGLDEHTLVVFTSDNGPWYLRGEHGGNATPFRASKGTTYEGGMRVPCIMRWPDTVPASSVCTELATAMDIMPTFANLAGTSPPADRIIDGKDIYPLISGVPGAKSPHEVFYYYSKHELRAVRSGPWKFKVETKLVNEGFYPGVGNPNASIPEALYNLETDPGEQKSVLKDHPDVVKRLRNLAAKAREDIGDSITGVKGKNVRPRGHFANGIESPVF